MHTMGANGLRRTIRTLRLACGLACGLLPGWAAALDPVADAPAPVVVQGRVFEDRNGDGRWQPGERGVASVAVSDGRSVTRSADDGRYRLESAPGRTVFAIKPAGWTLAAADSAAPLAWRQLSAGPAPALKYGGLRERWFDGSFDIALRRAPAHRDGLEVRVLADPQPKSRADVGYYGRDIVDSLLAEPKERPRAALGLSLGDIVDNALDLYPAINAETRRAAVPWLHVAGNHDVDRDAPDDATSLLTFRNVYGPDTFAWEESEAVFVGLDDVIARPGQSPAYIGGFRDDQFAFLEAYLPSVPKNRLLVIAVHIPLFEPEGGDTFRDADRARLFALLQAFPHVLLLSGHNHSQQHWYHDASTGWHGAQPLHEYNVGAACGAYWSGAKDAAGIPDTTMADGTPNGYARLHVDAQGRYALAWHPARDPRDTQIRLTLPKVLRHGAYAGWAVYANIFIAPDDAVVEYRIDDRAWQPMRRKPGLDPWLLRENQRDDDADALRGYDRSPEAEITPHLWRGTLPTDLAAGAHRVEVRYLDPWRGEQRASAEYRLDDASP